MLLIKCLCVPLALYLWTLFCEVLLSVHMPCFLLSLLLGFVLWGFWMRLMIMFVGRLCLNLFQERDVLRIFCIFRLLCTEMKFLKLELCLFLFVRILFLVRWLFLLSVSWLCVLKCVFWLCFEVRADVWAFLKWIMMPLLFFLCLLFWFYHH